MHCNNKERKKLGIFIIITIYYSFIPCTYTDTLFWCKKHNNSKISEHWRKKLITSASPNLWP